jgi:plasmid stability protein
MAHIQIRNVPEDVHLKLKERAAKAGMSLSEYLLAEIKRSAETPTMEEFIERVRSRPMFSLERSAAEIIREERERREAELDRR